MEDKQQMNKTTTDPIPPKPVITIETKNEPKRKATQDDNKDGQNDNENKKDKQSNNGGKPKTKPVPCKDTFTLYDKKKPT